MVHGKIDVMKFKGKSLGSMQISGVGDKVVPLVREIVRTELKGTACIVVHFMNHITYMVGKRVEKITIVSPKRYNFAYRHVIAKMVPLVELK